MVSDWMTQSLTMTKKFATYVNKMRGECIKCNSKFRDCLFLWSQGDEKYFSEMIQQEKCAVLVRTTTTSPLTDRYKHTKTFVPLVGPSLSEPSDKSWQGFPRSPPRLQPFSRQWGPGRSRVPCPVIITQPTTGPLISRRQPAATS